jgi:hypothetical protein
VKLFVALLAAVHFGWCAFDLYQWHFIDGVNLLIHEAGHVIFMPFGEFISIAGGSLFQLIVPAVFAAYFFRRGQFYSAALVLFWLGESMLNVAVYAGDALALQLPWIGGEDSIHVWNHMLDRTGMLKSTREIAGFIRLCGTALIIGASLIAYRYSADEARTRKSRIGFAKSSDGIE